MVNLRERLMSYASGNSYEEILARCLSDERLSDIDKRAGSIIFDSLAPLCMELAEAYIKMDIMNDQSYLLTAVGENLDKRVYDYGIVRRESSKAERIGEFKCYETDSNGNYVLDENDEKILIDMDVPIGSRFSVPNNSSLIFIMKEKREIGGEIKNVLECESGGSGGNTYVGTILPITPILNLVKATVGNVVTYGEDRESDDELRTRTQDYLNYVAFGGNIEDYLNKVGEQDGVGAVKVFPAYVDPTQVVLGIKVEEDEEIVPLQLTNIGSVIRTHSQYQYVGSGNGSYTLQDNEYTNVGTGNGDYNLISDSVPITKIKQLDFDGSVKVSVLSSDYNPMTPEAIAVIQENIDPKDESGFGGSGYGIAPIGHNVTIITPIEERLTVQLYVTVKSNTTVESETEEIQNAIIDYVESVRREFGQDITLEVVVSSIITAIKVRCPNVTNVTNVTLNGYETNKITYVDTPEEQKIPSVVASDIDVREEE